MLTGSIAAEDENIRRRPPRGAVKETQFMAIEAPQ